MAPPHPFKAFTVRSHGTINRIITDVAVAVAFDPASPPTPAPTHVDTKALWDTGATRSVISGALAKSLGLVAVGTCNVNHGGGVSTSPTYLINVRLPHGVGFYGVLVTEFPAPADDAFGVILGMDIICVGDFAITNVGGQTCVSFRAPSCEVIDYVAAANELNFGGGSGNDWCHVAAGRDTGSVTELRRRDARVVGH